MNPAISQADAERLLELAPDVLHDALAKCDRCPQLTRRKPDCEGCYIDDFRRLIARLTKERGGPVETTEEQCRQWRIEDFPEQFPDET